eukprot:scaffold1756_cov117-Isochrysis_galbana.AAC.11
MPPSPKLEEEWAGGARARCAGASPHSMALIDLSVPPLSHGHVSGRAGQPSNPLAVAPARLCGQRAEPAPWESGESARRHHWVTGGARACGEATASEQARAPPRRPGEDACQPGLHERSGSEPMRGTCSPGRTTAAVQQEHRGQARQPPWPWSQPARSPGAPAVQMENAGAAGVSARPGGLPPQCCPSGWTCTEAAPREAAGPRRLPGRQRQRAPPPATRAGCRARWHLPSPRRSGMPPARRPAPSTADARLGWVSFSGATTRGARETVFVLGSQKIIAARDRGDQSTNTICYFEKRAVDHWLHSAHGVQGARPIVE